MTTDTVMIANAGNADVAHASQIAEAANNQAGVIDPGASRAAEGLGEDISVSDAGDRGSTQQTDTGDGGTASNKRTLSPSPYDLRRSEIANNFRARRAERVADPGSPDSEAAEDVRQIQEFVANGGVPPELSEAVIADDEGDTGEVEAADTGRGTQQPQKVAPAQTEDGEPTYTLKVRGKADRVVTQAELIKIAQQNLAGDEYLAEARTTLDEVKRLRKDMDDVRSSTPGKHPPGDTADTRETQLSGTENVEHPDVDPFRETGEAFLYGDPQAAGDKLRELITKTVPAIVKQEGEQNRRQGEIARSRQAAAAFEKAHPELAGDDFTQDVIEVGVYRHQRKDLIDLGLNPAKLPQDKAAIARMHMTFRADPTYAGQVRPFDQLLEASRQDYVARVGGDSQRSAVTNGAETSASSSEAPSVEIVVNRTERRLAIPTQPSRTAVVKRVEQNTAPPQKSRSEIIQGMRKARGQTTAG